MGKKKAFVNKKTATQYRLVPKSTAEARPSEKTRFIPTEEHLEEQHKYGIYFDDDYDYLQHLRNISEIGTLQTLEEAAEQEERFILRSPKLVPPMPSELFKEKNAFNKVVEDRDEIYDEDIDNALKGNFDEELEGGLDDDFVNLAGGVADTKLKKSTEPRESLFCDETDEEVDEEACDFSYYEDDEEEQVRDGPNREIDDRFDKLLEVDYHDDQLGELNDDEGLVGAALEPNDERVRRMIKESCNGPVDDEQACKDWVKERLRLIEQNLVNDEEILEEVEVDEGLSKRLKWDCESYVTQYSKLYNHPTLIPSERSKLSKRSLKRLDRCAEIADQMEVDNNDDVSSKNDDAETKMTQASTFRPKGETTEQRRLRKQAVKLAKKFRRTEKKMNKEAFAEESRKIAKTRVGQIKFVSIA